jgi:2-oxoglutarate/2-oxoacid ferredoxin oxidoreductase subunit beta
VAVVSDIGCSGLFDTFFHTHALHGLHGRALTYATGLKMACPELTVIVVMGDGGLGIGGTHVLSACRRNLDITLLVLNNFNYGMTGGQCSATTPVGATTSSGFLNRLEAPLDICTVAGAAGAPWVERLVATDRKLSERLAGAIEFHGFALLDIRGICPGRFSKHNRTSLSHVEADLHKLPPANGIVAANQRPEYGTHYRQLAAAAPVSRSLARIEARHQHALSGRCQTLLLGAAGQRINTAGEVLCLAAMSSGLQVSQKNDYPITVLRGHSVSEVILDHESIGYTGIDKPDIVIALAAEGVMRRQQAFAALTPEDLVIRSERVELPPSRARIVDMSATDLGVAAQDQALAALTILCSESNIITCDALQDGCRLRFGGSTLDMALAVIDRCRR